MIIISIKGACLAYVVFPVVVHVHVLIYFEVTLISVQHKALVARCHQVEHFI